jgi:peptide deformylase
MVKEILIYPKDKEVLTSKSEEVKDVNEVKDLVQDLKDTLHSTEHGVGISAVQIGELKRVFVIHYNGQDRVFINPEITEKRGEQDSTEGCLSVPEKYGTFKRAAKITCVFTNENGEKKENSGGGLLARIIQHEYSHLEGWCEVFSLAEEE